MRPATTLNEYVRRQVKPLSPKVPLPLKPVSQVVAAHEHAPPAHVADAAQALPHAPQWARSVARLTHAPPQSACPAGHTHAPPAQLIAAAQALPQLPQWARSVARLTPKTKTILARIGPA